MKNYRLILAVEMITILVLQLVLDPASSFAQATSQSMHSKIDWSKAVVDSTLNRYPTGESLDAWGEEDGWGYCNALYLYGEYLVYLRTHDQRYFNHMKDWIDSHVDSRGNINAPLNALDFLLPGNLLLILYKETKMKKYKLAAQRIRKVFDTYSRTTDGGFWHAQNRARKWQLWADGTFMALPFLIRYGQMFGDSTYANDEVTKQMLLYYKHLNDPLTDLLFHYYDESGKQKCINSKTHQSLYHWGRAIGWYAMAIIEILEVLPKDYPKRNQLIAIVEQLAQAFKKYQDPKTGLWYQIVDKGSVKGNWLETSCSCMYTYMLFMGVKRGYLPKHYLDVAEKGYQGILTKISRRSDGLINLYDICQGTSCGNLQFYLHRQRLTNDPHGLGAFLIMNEQLAAQVLGYKPEQLNWSYN